MPVVTLNYAPRTHAVAIHRGMDTHRFGAVVAHRRFGKTVCAVMHLIVSCLENQRQHPVPRYAFIAPYLGQAKIAAWEYLTYYTRDIPGAVPMVSELKVTFPHGGYVRLFGADNPQAFRGGYWDGIVFDEFGEQPPNIYSEILRPSLSDYRGWALFLGTPAGKNQFYKTVKEAKTDPLWFWAEYKASQTGIIDAAELAAARKDMTDDEYEQEYECSFEASVKGAIFAAELAAARAGGRIGTVPMDPILPVHTVWDLGVGDATAIWFYQASRSGEIRVVDYYEASGEGLPHYAQMLSQKGYTYGTHWAPFDIEVKELGSGRSRLEVARSLGIHFKIVPQIGVEDGIHAARMLMPRCWFDEKRCSAGLEALQHYRRDYNSRLNEFKATPVHDWSSHAADAFRYLAVSQQTPRDKPKPRHQSGLYSSSQTDHGWLG